MLCPNCNTENRDAARFCDQCGFPLTNLADASLQQQPESQNEDQTYSDDRMMTASEDAAQEPAEEGGAEAPLAVDDDDAIETDYELYQPVDSESTDSMEAVEPAAAVDKLVFAGQEELLEQAKRHSLDLTGFDRHSDEYEERLISPATDAQPVSFRDGGTMQMPKVESDEPQKSRDYLASSASKRKSVRKPLILGAVCLLVVAAVAVFVTYQQGIWGGKLVPDTVGMTETDARAVLLDGGFTVRSEKLKSDDTEGLVLIMDPPAGSRADEGSEVVINVAIPREVPDVVGMTEEKAKEALAEEGYQNVKITKKNSEKAEGTVISVSPKAGQSANSSTEVTLTLAQPYTVPDVSGMLFDDAVAALKKAGLGYDVYYISTDDYPEGTIIGTEPAAGSVVQKGAYVMIQITQPRASVLEDAVRGQFSVGSTVDKNGRSYIVESLDSVAYLGNNTVSYTLTAREFLYVFGETVSAPSTESLSGTVVFDDDGNIVAIS